jgi:hypothetical protein
MQTRKRQHECLKNTQAILKEAGEKFSEGLAAKGIKKASVTQAMLDRVVPMSLFDRIANYD